MAARRVRVITFAVLGLAVVATATASAAGGTAVPSSEPPPNDAGVQTITGSVNYTNTYFTLGVAEPLVILEDQSGFVARDRNYVFPVASQVVGEITSDFYTSPFTYSIQLPIHPGGTFHDVDHDGVDEAGVVIFAAAYWTNTWGDTYLDERDQQGGGWSSAYASTKLSTDPKSFYEVDGGKYIVYSPDSGQDFPTAFGTDRKLFTYDDPVAPLPAGWSVIDMSQEPFAIERNATEAVDLLEPDDAALDDYSGLSYTAAFDAMLKKFRNEYAFTEYKHIDWDAEAAKYRPAFASAEAATDPHAYALALRDFLWSIPDSHVGSDTSLLDDDFAHDTSGGLGLALGETDDGHVIVDFLTEGGPAAKAGIQLGAEVTDLGGRPIDAILAATVPWSSPFSNVTIARLQQLRYATRFPLDTKTVGITYTNPGVATKTATLDVVDEQDSLRASSFFANASPTALPVEFSVLPSGLGYVKITGFADNELLTIQLWERAIRYMNDNGVPGLVIDMRINSGGSGWLANQMAAYFFDDRTIAGLTERYNEAIGKFFRDPDGESEMIPPAEALRYHGPVAVMVGPACVSACEFFSYAMTLKDRATVVGHYSSDGAGGSVEQFAMPEGIFVQMTIGRELDAAGNIHLEGKGVVPDHHVPVTVESLLGEARGDDVVLNATEQVLNDQLATATTEPTTASTGG